MGWWQELATFRTGFWEDRAAMELWKGLFVIGLSCLWVLANWLWAEPYYKSWGDMVGRPIKPQTLQWMRWMNVGTGCFFIVVTILVMTGVLKPSK